MPRIRTIAAALVLAGAALPAAAQNATPALNCVPQRPAANRASPYDSLRINLNGKQAMLCFGRPSSRGRTMIGGQVVSYGKLWRTGANEPTIIHIGFPAMIAGVHVEPGSYSIYTVPTENDWDVIINRSITQWGVESAYTDAIRAHEVGRGKARSEKTTDHVEMMTFRLANATARGGDLILEWEKTRVRIPISPM